METGTNYLDARLDELCSKLDRLIEVIQGDPTDENKPGLIIRLDRLEQYKKLIEKKQQQMMRLIIALSGGLGTVIAALIVKLI